MDSHRRQTLGAVSPNMMPARRMSVAPNRVAKGGAGAKPRQSLAPGSAMPARTAATSRRSGHGQKPADPRPLNVKDWAVATMKSVLVYIAANGYDQELDLKRLASPRKADWEALITFLMRQIDPRWSPSPAGANGKQPLEPDIEQFLKWAAYPHVPSKSALFTPGNASTWPQLLGVLKFLIDYLNYEGKKAAAVPQHSWENSEMATFFDFVVQTYQRYMNMDDDGDQRITNEFGASMQTRNEELRASNTATAEENAALQRRLAELCDSPAPLAVAHTELDEAAADRAALAHHIESYTAKRAKQEQHAARWAAEVAARREQLAQAAEENEELAARIAAQPYTAEEAARMNADKIKEAERLTAARKQKAGLAKARAAAQSKVSKRFDALDAAAQRFNAAAERLGLLAAGGGPGKRARGVTYEARVDATATAAADIMSADLKGGVRAGLEALRGAYQRAEEELTHQRFAAEERAATLADGNRSLHEDNLCLDHEVKRLDKTYNEAAATAEAAVRALQAEADALAAQAAELRGAASDDVAAAARAKADKQAELERLQLLCQEEMIVLNRELAGAIGVLYEHQAAVKGMLSKHKQEMEGLHERTRMQLVASEA